MFHGLDLSRPIGGWIIVHLFPLFIKLRWFVVGDVARQALGSLRLLFDKAFGTDFLPKEIYFTILPA